MPNLPSPKRQRERSEKAIEPVVFAPVMRDPFKKQSRITMLQDASGRFKRPGYRWQLSCGQSYWLDEDTADQFIIKGYATGQLSRKYSDDERAQIRSNVQGINLQREVLQDG